MIQTSIHMPYATLLIHFMHHCGKTKNVIPYELILN